MTVTVVSPPGYETITEYSREFEWRDSPGAGFSFPLDNAGNRTNCNQYSDVNWTRCIEGVDRGDIIDHGVQVNVREHYTPTVYRCDCGKTFPGYGDHECTCGRAYNAYGQELDAHALCCSTFADGFDCMCGERDQ